MRIVDPYGALTARNADAAHAQAMASHQAEHIRALIAAHLAEIEPEPEHPFARGYRMGLRVAYLAAGGVCDGSEEQWQEIAAPAPEPEGVEGR